MSGKKVGNVLKLFISKSGTSQRFDKSSIVLDKYGVQEDKFYNKDLQRSVLLSSYASYDLVKTYGIEMPFGYLGENILIDYNPYALEIGTHIK
ncbi:MAG: MOSC domain-containing protein, partial [Sulfurimonas sp.]|nr:MOSC domain-containing protein [Sulfurimonas sp.]